MCNPRTWSREFYPSCSSPRDAMVEVKETNSEATQVNCQTPTPPGSILQVWTHLLRVQPQTFLLLLGPSPYKGVPGVKHAKTKMSGIFHTYTYRQQSFHPEGGDKILSTSAAQSARQGLTSGEVKSLMFGGQDSVCSTLKARTQHVAL